MCNFNLILLQPHNPSFEKQFNVELLQLDCYVKNQEPSQTLNLWMNLGYRTMENGTQKWIKLKKKHKRYINNPNKAFLCILSIAQCLSQKNLKGLWIFLVTTEQPLSPGIYHHRFCGTGALRDARWGRTVFYHT